MGGGGFCLYAHTRITPSVFSVHSYVHLIHVGVHIRVCYSCTHLDMHTYEYVYPYTRVLQACVCKMQTVSAHVVSVCLKYVYRLQMHFNMKLFMCMYVCVQVCS